MNQKQSIIKSKLETIKKIDDRPKNSMDNVFDLSRDDLPSTDNVIRRKIGDYQDKRKATKTGNRDIFAELINTTEIFLGGSGDTNVDVDEKPKNMNKLMSFGTDAALETIRKSKQIVMDTVESELFSGDGICGNNNRFINDTLSISPKEFDFMNILEMSPESTTGKLVYEDDVDNGFIKMNKDFYETFDTLTYEFLTMKGEVLFSMTWDKTLQEYQISGLSKLNKIQNFLIEYYSNIEYPDLIGVIEETMYMTINGDGGEPKTFTIRMDWLNRLLKKIFSICGRSLEPKPFNQNPSDQLDDELNLEEYFNFEDPEGINMEDEDDRLNRVLNFVDCDNFKTEVDTSHIKDFVYFIRKGRNSSDVVKNTIDRVVQESYERSSKSIPPINLQISITLKYILNLPKAIIANVLSPKIFFPIVLVYKSVSKIIGEVDVIAVMKKMSKLFYTIIKKLFWDFITEFWKLLKKELLLFLKKIAIRILKNSIKRFKSILSSLISLLTKLASLNIGTCDAIYETILQAIESALNVSTNLPIPGIMLAFADTAPGYSTDRSYMKITEKMTASGIPMGPLYGRDNDLNSLVKSIVEGHTEEMDENSYVSIALKPIIIPAAVAGAVISPTVVGSGKIF